MDSKTSSTLFSAATLSSSEDQDSTYAEQLISAGEYKLLQGYFSEGLELFEQAEALVKDSNFSYRIGLSLFEFGSEEGREKSLLLANKKFKLAHHLDPENSDILHAWGNTLTLLGERQEEHHFFLEAKNKFEHALGLNPDSADLLGDYGVIWYHIAIQSGEALDLQKSIQAFERAIDQAEDFPSEFWIDYGASALLLSTKIDDVRLIAKAVNCFKHAVSQDKDCFDSWCSLAEALQLLYEHTHDEDHFMQANECFSTAAKLSPQEGDHWLDWAKFLLNSAHQNHDLKRVRACLEKCHHAHACDPENPLILATWTEGLGLLGQLTERLDLIYEAENKVSEALELDENDPAIWYSLGTCLCSFGAYFNDYDYYYQAIEKFQTGLSIDRTFDPLWHAIANTYAKVGGLEDDADTVLQSFKFYEKALSIKATSTRHIDYAQALSKLGEMLHEQKWLEQALYHFEIALNLQKNALYLHPEWLFAYASTLDMLGDFHDDDKYYTRAIEVFSHVLMVDPDFHQIHHRLAQALCHLGELLSESDYFYRAIHHLRLALRHDEDNDAIILDWGIALINVAQHTPILTDVESLMLEAEQKITLSAKLGNIQAYYSLSCLYSLLGQYDKSLHFLQKGGDFNALPSSDELLSDDWLDGLRLTPEFQEFLARHPHLQEEK